MSECQSTQTRNGWWGFGPDALLTWAKAGPQPPRVPSPAGSVLIGALGFLAASAFIFGSWAFAGKWMYRNLSELGAYLVWAVGAIAVAGLTLHSLVIGPRRLGKFYALFTVAFLLYAVGWTVAWFVLRNKTGEWLGSLVGTAVMSAVFVAAFEARAHVVKVVLVLFVTHSLGYFAGGYAFESWRDQMGMLLWGVAYGIGFGSGMGAALYLCQTEVRERLNPASSRQQMNSATGT